MCSSVTYLKILLIIHNCYFGVNLKRREQTNEHRDFTKTYIIFNNIFLFNNY